MPENQLQVQQVKRSKLSELLAAIGDGTLEADVSDQIVELVDTLREAGGEDGKSKGALKLSIKLSYDRGLVDVEADFAVQEPKIKRSRTVMYPVRGGGLSRQNPQQLDAFRTMDPPSTDIRSLAAI